MTREQELQAIRDVAELAAREIESGLCDELGNRQPDEAGNAGLPGIGPSGPGGRRLRSRAEVGAPQDQAPLRSDSLRS